MRGRRAALAVLLVLGCGLVALSLIAWYVRATVLNTDRYVSTMAPVAQSEPVQRAVADKLNTAITSKIDFGPLVEEALPPRAQPYAEAFGDTLRNAITSRIDAFVASDRFQEVWDEANRRVHSRVVALLTTGESRNLRLDGDTVYLDLAPAVDRVRQELTDAGLERLAGAIPTDVDSRVTLISSDAFVKAQDGIDLIQTLAIVLPILALLCLGGHVLLSRPRRRGLLRVGLGLLITALLLLALVGLGRSAYLDAIDQEVLPHDAAADIFDALIGLLRTAVRVTAIVALVVAGLALVLGRTGTLATDRRLGWVAEHRGLLQITAAGIGAIVLLAWNPPTAAVVLIDAALVAGAVLLIAAIAKTSGRAGSSAAGPPPAAAPPA